MEQCPKVKRIAQIIPVSVVAACWRRFPYPEHLLDRIIPCLLVFALKPGRELANVMEGDKTDEKSTGVVRRCTEQTSQSREFPWAVQEEQVRDRRNIETVVGDRMPSRLKGLIATSLTPESQIVTFCVDAQEFPLLADLKH
jgi:hypothetical protein